jgi:hypothetical protein
MTKLNSSNVKIFVNDIEVTGYAAGICGTKSQANVDYFTGEWITYPQPEPWTYIPKILGDVRGIISQEDRQLLKIVKTWNDKQVDNTIEQYIIEYNKFISKPKFYGKESWRCI